jgi:HTH-type transcriptional regulator, fmd operon transcriptional regulator
MARGWLTEGQYRVLVCRGKGMTQQQTAKELGTTRANVSMIELRARKRVSLARQTLEAYASTLTDHVVGIARGTRFYDIPSSVIKEADRWGVHLQSNIVDITKMVNGISPSCLASGRTTRSIFFVFNRAGKLRVRSGHRQQPRA